jgi:hypothetical protein
MATQAKGLTVSLSGDDTFQINNQVISTLANQDPGHVTFPNELATVEQGKNGTTIYAQNPMGQIADFVIRILLAGIDDQYLNSLLQQQSTGFSDFTLMTGVFNKRVGDGKGNILTVQYQLSGGIVSKGIEAMTSARGDVNQSVAVWPLRFGNWSRYIV